MPNRAASPPPPPSPPKTRRPSYRAARAFYLTVFIAACLAFYTTLAHSNTAHNDLYKRVTLNGPDSADEECRLVHRASPTNQCAFIRSHCPDDEAGFTAYLELYYCRLNKAKPVAFVILVSWLGLLFSTIGIAASDFFCINLSTIASLLGMSESMAGVTLLAFGNGSPDVFSTFAAMSTNSGSLAVGELFGAAGFITAVVAGSMALIRPFHVARKSFVRDVGFFLVAAAFSLVFLWDGKLRFWECIAMVVYYIFYVVVVVAWHWWIGRRRRRREKDMAARGHFVNEEMDIEQEYHDDPDEVAEGTHRRPSMIRGVSMEDWSALENGGTPYADGPQDEDDEEEARDRWMSELSSNMRLTRPTVRSRKNTINSVRPSLVGALEFQAVLKSLQKSRNIQTIPLDARRYSDDPSFTTAQQQDQMSSVSDPASRPPFSITVNDSGEPETQKAHLDVPKSAPARTRAVSTNDIGSLRLDPDFARAAATPPQHSLIDISDFANRPERPRSLLAVPGGNDSQPQSPRQEATTSDAPLRIDTSVADQPQGHLTPFKPTIFRQLSDHFAPKSLQRAGTDSPRQSPRSVPSARRLPKIVIPRPELPSYPSTAVSSPLPRYRDDMLSPASSSHPPSLHLPPPVTSPESLPVSQCAEQEMLPPEKPVKWWPYRILPAPGVIVATLFPTIYHWREKNWWERCLGIVAAPSVFLLTITLPVVENDSNGDESAGAPVDNSFDSALSKHASGAPEEVIDSAKDVTAEQLLDERLQPGMHRHSITTAGTGPGTGIANLAADTEDHQHRQAAAEPPRSNSLTLEAAIGATTTTPPNPHGAKDEYWNRWLTITHLFLSPLLVLLAIWAQSPTDFTPLKPVLISLLVSAVLLIPFLLTTTPTHRPAAYRPILSAAGFIVSIAWISTIASQVVGALKALAVILNMSHAIMGLTIFAVGNSLGDLVADVTVARLGYPVMALSACFGGPLLNILLGIGLSGSYILIRAAHKRHDKHPDQPVHFKSYHIEVGQTLIVSGATLVVTLIGLLVAVPLNRWMLSRRIGVGLVVLWVGSTIVNVALEVGGRWGSETTVAN
ncbi:hypothetical protein BAUCODRAFT_39617 [Baudoinia panamericana UAMH 10762]|uniref:Sodium/calcium exchanger membrane region domain-containing protein n=1 Tax=Baudoinia panamericana (strain UAMH 10762) TaxID=717646 RepID=M2M4C7_BAUPA|nr:uncharacterized protein BAUCODRAFT_39617 [Baudoinia panamericana UAMH 10762]EMC91441.1 hypothetical protein BAUCODRAFT_39617 [Baudoinia panamericana UAMH 10762]